MNNKNMLMSEIQSNAFAALERNLFLDIFPEDRQILKEYNNYNNKKIIASNQYEKLYGPLTLNSNELQKYPWQWINEPWPWEGDL